jgi:hypothetical protein
MGLVLAAAIAMGTATACREEGPAEQLGEAIDEAAEEAKEEVEDALGE